jgi:hypothetical protein
VRVLGLAAALFFTVGVGSGHACISINIGGSGDGAALGGSPSSVEPGGMITFTITGLESGAHWQAGIEGHGVYASGEAGDGAVSGSFAAPDLGSWNGPINLVVTAEHSDIPDGTTSRASTLTIDYLGNPVPPPPPPGGGVTPPPPPAPTSGAKPTPTGASVPGGSIGPAAPPTSGPPPTGSGPSGPAPPPSTHTAAVPPPPRATAHAVEPSATRARAAPRIRHAARRANRPPPALPRLELRPTAPVRAAPGTFGGSTASSGASFFDRLFGAAEPAPKPKVRVNGERRAQR